MTPDWYEHDDWHELSEAMQRRACAWHERSLTVKRLIVRGEAMAAESRREIAAERRRLRNEQAMAAMADPVEDVDLHLKEDEEEERPVEPPAGELPPRPTYGEGKWPQRVYDMMAERQDWLTMPQIAEHFGVNQHKVYNGVRLLRRDGLVVEGPTIVVGHRRTKQYQLARSNQPISTREENVFA